MQKQSTGQVAKGLSTGGVIAAQQCHGVGRFFRYALRAPLQKRPSWQALSLNLKVRFATRATGGQFIVALSSYRTRMVVRPLLTFKHL